MLNLIRLRAASLLDVARLVLLCCCLAWMASGVLVVLAQDRGAQDQRITDVERRLNDYDGLKLDARVTRLEAMAESNHSLLIGIASCIGILVIETGIRVLRPGRPQPPLRTPGD